MRKLFITLLALSLTLSLFGCRHADEENTASGAVSQSADKVVYEISDFTFEAPSDWTYEDIGDDVLKFNTGYMIYEWDGDLIETDADDEFIENQLGLTELTYEDFELTAGPTRKTMGGCNGFTYEFQYTSDGETAQGRAATLFADSGMLTFTLCDLDTENLHNEDFESLIGSLTRK